jgi:hypothetical protein
VGVESPAGPMDEPGSHYPGGAEVVHLARPHPTHPVPLTLEVLDGIVYRLPVRSAGGSTEFGRGQEVEDAD